MLKNLRFDKLTNSGKEIPNTILRGNLYLKEIGNLKQQISEEAIISLKILDEKNFDYLLNVENEEFDEENESWKILQFKITNECHFKTYINKNENYCLMWQKNLSFFIFEFFNDAEIKSNRPIFLENLSVLITSNDFNIDIAKAKKEETKSQYIMVYDVIEDIDKFIEDNYQNLKESNQMNEMNKQMLNMKISLIKLNELFPNSTTIFSKEGNLFKYNKDTEKTELIIENGLFLIIKVENFTYYIICEENNSVVVYTKICQNANILIFDKENIIMFADIKGEKGKEKAEAYSFSFSQNFNIETLKKLISKCLYETSSLVPYEQLENSSKMIIDNINNLNESFQSTNTDVQEKDIEFGDSTENKDLEHKNKFSVQAYLYDRTFVAKDNNTIEVFKPNNSGNLLSVMNIPSVNEYEGKKIDLNKAKMFMSDTNMLLKDKKNNNSLFQFDIEKGKIIEEWNTGNMNILDFNHSKKFNQMEDDKVINCINENNILILDGRIDKHNKIAKIKQYKTNPKFNCITSTLTGNTAIGSINGDIRLYDDLTKKAKTLLSTYGDPIRAIDVTKDGSYILATCDKYLIIINTVNDNNNLNGFEKPLGKSKHGPKTLKISPQDVVKYGLENDKFTPAKFNISKNDKESNITTSIGEYIVIWNFKKIQKGIVNQYKIKKVNQFVIENTYKYNKNQVIVTMPNNLRIQNQKYCDYE